jgi:hypothetical protein
MAYYERLPTRLNPLAERTCFSQVENAELILYGASGRGLSLSAAIEAVMECEYLSERAQSQL